MARWSKQPNHSGLAKVCQCERGYILKEKGKELIHVEIDYNGRWIWYGIGRNTYSEGLFFKTKEDAKADADKYYKRWRKYEK